MVETWCVQANEFFFSSLSQNNIQEKPSEPKMLILLVVDL